MNALQAAQLAYSSRLKPGKGFRPPGVSGRRRKTVFCCAVVAGLALSFSAGAAVPALAQSLPQALSRAYLNHPALEAERARLRATDEGVSQALAGWRPEVTGKSSIGKAWSKSDPGDGRHANEPVNFTLTLSQPVFEGLRTQADVARAEANVEAGRQALLAIEQRVLLDATMAYADVARDRAIAILRRKNVSMLAERLRAAQARFKVGEITRTDVEQAKARLQLSRANLATARADMAVSEENFLRATGQRPGKLVWPEVPPQKPKSLDEALTLANWFNPDVLAAVHAETAARHLVDFRRGELLPSVSLGLRYQRHFNPSHLVDDSEAFAITGEISVPIFEGGDEYSRVREAQQLARRRQFMLDDQRQRIRAEVLRAWRRFGEAQQVIRAVQAQVRANELALEGVMQEERVGSRTTLDVLDAETELVESRVSLAQARRNRVVRAYEIIAATGKMTAQALKLDVAAYDPAAHLTDIRGKWIGFGETE